MNIGGWQKVSLLDFPEKISTIIFTNGCPFRCPFCYNPDLVLPPFENKYPSKEIFEYLKKRRGFIDAVTITGGEPTAQRSLLQFISKLKRLGYLVKLDTNGYRPVIVQCLIGSKLIDYIAMDIKAPLENYSSLAGVKVDNNKILESIRIILSSNIPYEFRSTIISNIHRKNDVIGMAKLINGAERYYLQRFRPHTNLIDESFQNYGTYTEKQFEDLTTECEKYVKDCSWR